MNELTAKTIAESHARPSAGVLMLVAAAPRREANLVAHQMPKSDPI